MDVEQPLTLLGGLSPATFMRRHWQKKPLLVRQAWPGVRPPLTRAGMFEIAAREGVESRLVSRAAGRWVVRHGPLARRALPPVSRPDWTLLVQGLDLHVPEAAAMRARFRFVPDARLDDLMASWASPGGGVGPHVDSYDVFLIQAHGRRRWRVAPPGDESFVDGLPLKILRHFEPVHDWVLEPGDLLYLPPGWGHDGVAEGGECITCSVGFLAVGRDELARDLLQRLADEDGERGPLYRDPRQPATSAPAAIPGALHDFARAALGRVLADRDALARVLGESLTEPKPRVWFDPGMALAAGAGVRLDARTRMMYDARHVFINGEAFRASGRDARLVRRLADERALAAGDVSRLSAEAAALLSAWAEAGWLHGEKA